MTALDPRTHTWAYGKKQVVRYSVGVLKPITNETEKA
jgi:hypothetical protein